MEKLASRLFVHLDRNLDGKIGPADGDQTHQTFLGASRENLQAMLKGNKSVRQSLRAGHRSLRKADRRQNWGRLGYELSAYIGKDQMMHYVELQKRISAANRAYKAFASLVASPAVVTAMQNSLAPKR